MGSAAIKLSAGKKEPALLRLDAVKTVSNVMRESGSVVFLQLVSLTSATSCGSAKVMSTH